MVHISMPNDVTFLINSLKSHGFRAYAVGGCVRDSLLGRTPSDWDITTNATPCRVKEIFDKTIDTGLKHGTVTVMIKGQPYEITTFRNDGVYSDSRHPESVEFTDDLIDDLSRRDFTINAMAYNDDEGIIDPFSGIIDLQNSIIRCVGDPVKRFREDALRMLRAVRFSAQLCFLISNDIIDAIVNNSKSILNISAERIQVELNKILLSVNIEYSFGILHESSLLKYIIPELDVCFATEQNIKYHLYNVGKHSLIVTANTPPLLHLRYAALLHDIGKPKMRKTGPDGTDTFRGHGEVSTIFAGNFLRRIRMDNKNTNKILRLIKYHDREIVASKKAVKRAILDVGDDIFSDLIELKRAEVPAQNPQYSKARLPHYEKVLSIYNEIKSTDEAFTLAKLAINGHDIIKLGFTGKDIGVILKNVLLYIIAKPECNTKEKIIKVIKENVDKWLNLN